MPLPWIYTTRTSMQRLGFLKILVALVDRYGRATQEKFSQLFMNVVGRTNKLEVNLADYPDLARHFVRFRFGIPSREGLNRYPELEGRLTQVRRIAGGSRGENCVVPVWFEDVALSAPFLPSNSGAISEEMSDEPISLMQSLQLYDRGKGVLTETGEFIRDCLLREAESKLLQRICHGEPLRADDIKALREDPSTNPFYLDPAQRLFFLHYILKFDGYMLYELYSRILKRYSGNRVFARYIQARSTPEPKGDLGVGDLLADHNGEPGVLNALYKKFKPFAQTSGDRQSLEELKSNAKLIKEFRTKPPGGSGVPMFQRVTFRLESMMDVGMLERATSRRDYVYRFTHSGLAFFTRFVKFIESLEDGTVGQTDDGVILELFNLLTRRRIYSYIHFVDCFLYTSFYGAWSDACAPELSACEDDRRLIAHLAGLAPRLRQGFGYVSVRNLFILANAETLRKSSLPREYYETAHSLRTVLGYSVPSGAGGALVNALPDRNRIFKERIKFEPALLKTLQGAGGGPQ